MAPPASRRDPRPVARCHAAEAAPRPRPIRRPGRGGGRRLRYHRGVKLARKLTVALVLGIFAVLAVHSYTRVRLETRLFENDARRDGHTIARVLGKAAARVWRTDGEARARQLVREVNEAESQVNIRWISLDAPDGSPDAPRLDRAALEPIRRWEEVAGKVRDADGAEDLVTCAPLRVGDTLQGAIEISESMAGEQGYIRATIVNALSASAALALVCGAMTIGLGVWFVGRPMRSLIEQARRVGSGDLSRRLHLRQEDEIRELADEMNAMCDRLDDANRRAAAEVARRIEALEHLRHADRLATVGKLASGVAHELGAPLQVVSARAKMIADGEVTGDEAQEYARIIHEQVGRMAALIRQLLDFARRKAADKAPADLADLARKVCQLLAPIADKGRVALSVEAACGPAAGDPAASLEAMVDAEQIQQALTNLIVNGIHAMPGGGALAIRVGRERAHPPTGPGEERAGLRVDVEDHGEGMAPEMLERVFEPFFTTKPPGEGTGLGLAVAQEIVRGHGGWMSVRSQMGKGSCFSIHLPADPLPAEAAR